MDETLRRSLYRHHNEIKNASASEFLDKFFVLNNAEIFAHEILPYFVANNWNYTLHDFNHSQRVIENINLILDLLGNRPLDGSLNNKEIELLYVAAWYHDIGMAAMPRSNETKSVHHSDASCEFIEAIWDGQAPFNSQEFKNALCTLILTHTHGLEIILPHPDSYLIDECNINMRRVSSIFSLADLLDMGTKRVSQIAFDFLANKEYMMKITEQFGGHTYPYLSEDSISHWNDNLNTSIQIKVAERQIFIGYRSVNKDAEKLVASLENKKKNIEKYLEILNLNDVCVILSAE